MVIFIAALVNVYTLEERRNVEISWAILCHLSFANLDIFSYWWDKDRDSFHVIDNILYLSHEKWEIYRW